MYRRTLFLFSLMASAALLSFGLSHYLKRSTHAPRREPPRVAEVAERDHGRGSLEKPTLYDWNQQNVQYNRQYGHDSYYHNNNGNYYYQQQPVQQQGQSGYYYYDSNGDLQYYQPY